MSNESFKERINSAAVAVMDVVEQFSVLPADNSQIIIEIANTLQTCPAERKVKESEDKFAKNSKEAIVKKHIAICETPGYLLKDCAQNLSILAGSFKLAEVNSLFFNEEGGTS